MKDKGYSCKQTPISSSGTYSESGGWWEAVQCLDLTMLCRVLLWALGCTSQTLVC